MLSKIKNLFAHSKKIVDTKVVSVDTIRDTDRGEEARGTKVRDDFRRQFEEAINEGWILSHTSSGVAIGMNHVIEWYHALFVKYEK